MLTYFFEFITKTVDVFTSMRFRDRIKCLLEILFISIILLVVFLIASAICGSIFANTFGMLPNSIYSLVKNILESICTIFYLIVSITVLLHIFKIRYLDYYEIVKENNTAEEETEKENNIQEEQEKYDEKRKIFIEKKKDKIIIRDPEHSQSRFLNGLFRIILAFIKFIAICLAACFVFTFIALFCLLILSFMFVKTGLVFWGSLFAIIAGIIVNFIILELFYNFIISKKSKKTRMAISFIVSLILAGISIGMILIGITDFKIVENNSDSFTMEKVYEYDMTENLSLDCYNCAYKYIETDSNKIKIVVKHTEFSEINVYDGNDVIGIYCNSSGSKIIDLIKTIINDLNNKEIRDYPGCAEVTIYTSKNNIEKLRQNEIKRYELSIENELNQVNEELNQAHEKNEELESEIIELKDEIMDKENKIEELQLEIENVQMEIVE